MGSKGKIEAEFIRLRVWSAYRWQDGVPTDAIPDAVGTARWLLVEWRWDGTITYALSKLPSATTIEEAGQVAGRARV